MKSSQYNYLRLQKQAPSFFQSEALWAAVTTARLSMAFSSCGGGVGVGIEISRERQVSELDKYKQEHGVDSQVF